VRRPICILLLISSSFFFEISFPKEPDLLWRARGFYSGLPSFARAYPVAAAHFSWENGPREDYSSGVVSEIRLDESKFSSDGLEELAEFLMLRYCITCMVSVRLLSSRDASTHAANRTGLRSVSLPKEGKLVLTELPQQSVGCSQFGG